MDGLDHFFSNRSQCVILNGCKSEPVPVTSGIPQGSVLGPLLIVIYINDLPDSVRSNVYPFADDAKIYKRINSLNDHDILQHNIDNLTKWSSDWLLTLNPDKSKVLKVAKNTFKDSDYVMQNHTLQFISQEKYLGVILNYKMSLDAHINGNISKANEILGIIRRTFTVYILCMVTIIKEAY